MGVSGSGREIQRAWAKRGHANSRLSGKPTVRCRHESRSLFVPRENKFYFRVTQRLHDIEIFFPGNTEDPLNSFILQGGDEKIRTFSHGASFKAYLERIISSA